MNRKLTAVQEKALHHIRSHGGRIVRYSGGFWSLPQIPGELSLLEWWIDIRTVRSMEAKGILKRTYEREEEWADPRILEDTR